jgi:hypothetical protein
VAPQRRDGVEDLGVLVLESVDVHDGSVKGVKKIQLKRVHCLVPIKRYTSKGLCEAPVVAVLVDADA